MGMMSPVPALPHYIIFCALVGLTLSDCPISSYPSSTTVGTYCTISGSIHADFSPAVQNGSALSYWDPLVEQAEDAEASRTVVGVAGFDLERRGGEFGYRIGISYGSGSRASRVVF
jgi:hypothetical protein